ncbi:MAG: ATP synthase subunit I [Filifactoraceae bacterium]
MNSELLRFQGRIIGFQIVFLAIVGLLCMLVTKQPKPYILGLVFGGGIGALSFRMMGISLEKTLKMSPDSAKINAGINYFIRMFIYGSVLFVAVRADYISVITTTLGLVAIKIVILFLNFFKIKF